MNTIINIFEKYNGRLTTKHLKKYRIGMRSLNKAIKDGIIERTKRGLYKLKDYPEDENSSFVDICMANKKAVICLLSAASYYELTTYNPKVNDVAVPNNANIFKLEYPPIHVYYFINKYYEPAIETVKAINGEFRIYNKEKTIGDLFRYKNKIGDDVAIESLKNYLKDKKSCNIPKLLEYAKICGSLKTIVPIIRVILL